MIAQINEATQQWSTTETRPEWKTILTAAALNRNLGNQDYAEQLYRLGLISAQHVSREELVAFLTDTLWTNT